MYYKKFVEYWLFFLASNLRISDFMLPVTIFSSLLSTSRSGAEFLTNKKALSKMKKHPAKINSLIKIFFTA